MWCMGLHSVVVLFSSSSSRSSSNRSSSDGSGVRGVIRLWFPSWRLFLDGVCSVNISYIERVAVELALWFRLIDNID